MSVNYDNAISARNTLHVMARDGRLTREQMYVGKALVFVHAVENYNPIVIASAAKALDEEGIFASSIKRQYPMGGLTYDYVNNVIARVQFA